MLPDSLMLSHVSTHTTHNQKDKNTPNISLRVSPPRPACVPLQPLAMPPVAVTWDIEPCPYVAAAASTSNTTAAAAAGSTHSHPHHHHEQQQQGGSSIANSRSRSSGSCSSSGGGGSAVVAAAAPAVKEAASPLPDSAAVAAGAADGRSRRRAKDSGAVVYVTVKLKAGKVRPDWAVLCLGLLWACPGLVLLLIFRKLSVGESLVARHREARSSLFPPAFTCCVCLYLYMCVCVPRCLLGCR